MISYLVIATILIALYLFVFRRFRSGEAMANVVDTRNQVISDLDRRSGGVKHKFLVRALHGMKNVAQFGDVVYLFPEPKNPVDQNAIVVSNENTDAIGYIAREENADLSDYLQNEGLYSARIIWTTDDIPMRYMVEVLTTERIEGDRY